ncbi:MAG: YceI family protein [Bacteroidota bacterium]|nr:YceI family protein [Parabacteroides sp.]MDT3369353.1 YceI family protein [Bacteroidota bacterium]
MKAYYLLAAVALFIATSCSSKSGNKVDASDAKEATANVGSQKLVVDTLASTVAWKGYKPGGSHHGTLGIKQGELSVENGELVSGTFTLDMNKILCEDLTDAKMNEQLVGHLKSADFFDVAKYPEGKFTITTVEKLNDGVNSHRISGNLELKGVSKNITFDANVTNEGTIYKATTATFTIDRTQWGVNYGSKNIFKDLKDSFINDDMEVTITIVANAE